MKGESGANSNRAELQRTHQDDLLNVLGRTPMKHPRGVVLLHILVHALDLLVARDEQWVVSGVEGETERVLKGIVRRNEKVAGVLQENFCAQILGWLTFSNHKDSVLEFVCSQGFFVSALRPVYILNPLFTST